MRRLQAFVARNWRALCLGLVLLLVAADTARNLHSFGFRFVDDDIVVFWYGAKEFIHGRFREPALYGQSYDTLIESLPGGLLVGFGVSLWVSLSFVSTAFGLLPWLLMAFLAWRRGAENLALLLAAGPLLLPDSYTFVLDKFYGAGILAVAGAIVLIEKPGRQWRNFAFGFLVALGCLVLYQNAVVLGIPAVVYVAITRWRQWGAYALMAAGGALGVAVEVAIQEWYQRHPGWALHPSATNEWTLYNVGHGLKHINDFLEWFAPWFAPWGGLDLIALGGVAVFMLWRRNVTAAVVATSALATAVVLLGFDKVHDGRTYVFFSFARFFVAMPIVIAFVAVVAVRGARKLDARWAAAVLFLAVISLAYRQATLNSAVASSGFDAPAGVTSPRLVASLEVQCDTILRVAQANGADLVVDVFDRGIAAGCGAIDYGKVETLYPPYERRTWRLEEERDATRTVIVFSEASPQLCDEAAAHGFTCTLISGTPTTAVVRTPPMSPLEVIADLGIVIRPFS